LTGIESDAETLLAAYIALSIDLDACTHISPNRLSLLTSTTAILDDVLVQHANKESFEALVKGAAALIVRPGATAQTSAAIHALCLLTTISIDGSGKLFSRVLPEVLLSISSGIGSWPTPVVAETARFLEALASERVSDTVSISFTRLISTYLGWSVEPIHRLKYLHYYPADTIAQSSSHSGFCWSGSDISANYLHNLAYHTASHRCRHSDSTSACSHHLCCLSYPATT